MESTNAKELHYMKLRRKHLTHWQLIMISDKSKHTSKSVKNLKTTSKAGGSLKEVFKTLMKLSLRLLPSSKTMLIFWKKSLILTTQNFNLLGILKKWSINRKNWKQPLLK